MDSDFPQSYKQSAIKINSFYPKKFTPFPDIYKKSQRNPNKKVQYCTKPVIAFSKPTFKPQTKESSMNQLAPRFQQRAMYSQHYRTDYDNSWRANLLAANYRTRYYNKPREPDPIKNISKLGVRPEPEGAPSTLPDECETPSKYADYDNALNEDTVLYSDYGSDIDDLNTPEDLKSSQDPNDQIPDSSWTTASLITHAFNKANCNKVTVMTYAVIGAELHSISKLHTSKTEVELSKISKRTQKLTESIDKARKSLKEIALGLRSCKQELKLKTNNQQESKLEKFQIEQEHDIQFLMEKFSLKYKRTSNTHKSLKHSAPVIFSKSDLSSNSQDVERRLNKRKSLVVMEQVSMDQFDDTGLPNYCTVDRRHRYYKERRSTRLPGSTISMMNYMNLDGVDKTMKLKEKSQIHLD